MHTIDATREHLNSAAAFQGKTWLTPEYFNFVKAGHADLNAKAWNHLARCHVHLEETYDFDEPFVDTAATYQIVHDICQSYNQLNSLDGILASLYLQHRQRFLRIYQDFYVFNGGYFSAYPCNEGEDCERISAYGIFGRFGPNGDIVDFDSIDPDKVGFAWNRPVAELWAQLKSDWKMPLGVVNYYAALEMVDLAVGDTLASETRKLNQSKAIQNLSKWVLDSELNHENPMPGIALASHAILLAGM